MNHFLSMTFQELEYKEKFERGNVLALTCEEIRVCYREKCEKLIF